LDALYGVLEDEVQPMLDIASGLGDEVDKLNRGIIPSEHPIYQFAPI
jgi:hypothetical protein